MKHRPDIIREQMQRYFGLGQVLSCQVKGPDGIQYQIDGYPANPGYRCSYFKGMLIKVNIASDHQAAFSHWLVNGEKVPGKDLVYQVKSETVIEPVLSIASN